MGFVNHKDRKAIATAFKPIYTAVDADAAKAEFEAFKKSPLRQKYPHAVAAWEAA
jgi:putative transposase